MDVFRHLLVPIDFSDASRHALRRADALARVLGADITVMHVWEPAPAVTPAQLGWLATDTGTFYGHVELDLKDRARAFLAEVLPDRSEDEIPIVVEAGYVAHTILEALRTGSYDLVVMGTHGRRGLSHLVLGSVAERLVRSAPCPVLTTRVVDGIASADTSPPNDDAVTGA